MALKAVKPGEAKPSKVKMLISGDPGTGKTWFSLDWPSCYLIDAEGGAVRKQYQDKLKKVNGLYFGQEQGAGSFQAVIDEVKTLATTKHDRKTLIIDSFSHLYINEAAIAEEKVGDAFGKDKKEANKPTRQLMRWINKCDMNVILIAHNKAKWVRKGSEIFQDGNTFDGYAKLEYDLDLYIEILPGYKNFIIKKSRIESLPQGDTMPLSYKHFAEIYGADAIESEVKPADMASEKQINKILSLIEALNIDSVQIDKWYKKIDVESWDEMTSEQITSLTNVLINKIEGLNKEKSNGTTNSKSK
jgi:hypothetical protein